MRMKHKQHKSNTKTYELLFPTDTILQLEPVAGKSATIHWQYLEEMEKQNPIPQLFFHILPLQDYKISS